MAKKEANKEEVDLVKVKEDLKDYVNIQIKKGFSEELERSNKRLLREKNGKILFRDIIIILFFLIILGLVYLLYDVGYFNRFFKDNKESSIPPIVEPEKELTLDELKELYGHLLDNVVISEESDYIGDFYNARLTDELKLYFALNLVDINSLPREDDINIIPSKIIKASFEKLFEGEFKNKSFDYDYIRLRYVESLDSYITDELLERSTSNIKRDIIDIKVDKGLVYITTVEGLRDDGVLFNITTNKEISDKNCVSMSKCITKLDKITYVFENNKLIKLEK